MSEAETTAAAATRNDAVAKLAGALGNDAFGTGPLAELRRMDPGGPLPALPALHRLLARHVPDRWTGTESGVHAWALVIHLLALMAGRDTAGGEPLGAALFAAGYSEGRLTRLLAADASQLAVALPRMVRFLLARGHAASPYELAALVLDRDPDPARLRLARAYYRAEADKDRAEARTA